MGEKEVVTVKRDLVNFLSDIEIMMLEKLYLEHFKITICDPLPDMDLQIENSMDMNGMMTFKIIPIRNDFNINSSMDHIKEFGDKYKLEYFYSNGPVFYKEMKHYFKIEILKHELSYLDEKGHDEVKKLVNKLTVVTLL